MDLVRMLELGRDDFLDAAHSSRSGAERAGGWSVCECVEHVVIFEERHLRRLISARPGGAPPRDTDRELRLFTMVRSRLSPVEAPPALRPKGQFATLAAAVEAFRDVRARGIAHAREHAAGLYEVSAMHPFFGKVNGVELLQLIDAHARRHADQIREIIETPPPVRQKRPSGSFGRDAPDLPTSLQAGELAAGDIEDARIADVHLNGWEAGALRLSGSVLERVQLNGAGLGSAIWKDVRLVECDLANLRVHRMNLLRVELVRCRLAGVAASSLEGRHVLFEECDLRYAALRGCKLRNVELQRCDLREADLGEADLEGCILRACRLGGSDLQGARLAGTDLRRSEIESMLVKIADLRGAIVEPAQAMLFARLIGLKIE